MTRTIMITTGGTGGHVFPGIAVARRLIEAGCEVFWLGTRRGMEATIVPQHGVDFEAIDFIALRGKGAKRVLGAPYLLTRALWQSFRVIRRRRPTVVIGFGGFVSFPGALMGRLLNRKLVIHDANAVAGLANRILAFVAHRVCLGFPKAMRGRHAKKTQWTGNPLRDEIGTLPPPEVRFAHRSGRLKLLVVGGSLGATALNRCTPAALALLPHRERPQVVHQAGEKHIDELRGSYERLGVEAECLPFIPDMAARYADADLLLCRGGALTISEVAAVGLASIVVPLPGAIADEQTQNAQWLVDAGAAWLMPQSQLNPARLAELLRESSRGRLLSMAQAAHGVGRRDAAEQVANICAALAES